MRGHWSKVAIGGLLAIILGVPFALRSGGAAGKGGDVQPGAKGSAGGGTLIIYTPHNEQIRYEFARAFNQWRVKQGLPTVAFDWRASGGASDLRKQVLTQYEAAAAAGDEDRGIGVDLFFGGGVYEHNKLAVGVTVIRDGRKRRISASTPIQLPPRLLKTVFPRPTIGGERLYDKQLHWVGVVLSSFGIVYNRDVLHMLHLSEPRTWADLHNPRYRGWVALADPAHSGSIAATYETILRRTGWTRGWASLRRIFANTRYFTASSSKIPVDVSAGEAAAGMCIDFYGRFQAGAVDHPERDAAGGAKRGGSVGDRVGYVDPAGMTATTADPISLLRGAPHRKLARQFILWLLSAPAQTLWQKRVGTPGGPARFELRRQPIRRDVYTPARKAQWTDPEIDPFDTAKPLPPHTPHYYRYVAPVAHAMAIDVHEELVRAWRAMQRTASDDPHRAEMRRLFDALPPTLTVTWPKGASATTWEQAVVTPSAPRHPAASEAIGRFVARLNARYRHHPDRLLRDRVRWTLFFRHHYQRVVALAE